MNNQIAQAHSACQTKQNVQGGIFVIWYMYHNNNTCTLDLLKVIAYDVMEDPL